MSRSRLVLPGAGAEPIWTKPESAPGPRTSRAGTAQKVAAQRHLMNEYRYIGIKLINQFIFYQFFLRATSVDTSLFNRFKKYVYSSLKINFSSLPGPGN